MTLSSSWEVTFSLSLFKADFQEHGKPLGKLRGRVGRGVHAWLGFTFQPYLLSVWCQMLASLNLSFLTSKETAALQSWEQWDSGK